MIRTKLVAGVAALMAGGCVLASPASAAPQEIPLDCGGQTITVRVNESSSSDNGGWGAAQIVGRTGHLVPTSFTFAATDVTTGGNELFSFTQDKGNGNGNHNQGPGITCSAEVFTGTLADVLEPGQPVPPGANLTDEVVVTILVTAVLH